MSSAPTVGVVGGGQLARMMQQAAIPLDVTLRVLAARPDDSAAQVCPDVVVGSPDTGLSELAAGCDVVTFDHELVDPAALAASAAAGGTLRPSAAAQAYAQDKAYQREAFAAAGLPIPSYGVADTVDEATGLAERLGWPMVVKTPRGGYDGRGVVVVEGAAELAATWPALGGGPLLCEAHVPLVAELAVLVARRPGGQAVAYPVVGTEQRDGILVELHVPAAVSETVARRAEAAALAVADVVDHAGILAVELFFDGTQVLVNEVATRPHNSGHWTIEGATTSQFANHLRGVLDWPLGTTTMTAPAAVTVNLLGPEDGTDPAARLPAALEVSDVAVHLYGKAARAGRKLGHVTALAGSVEKAAADARRAAAVLTEGRDS